MSKCTLYKLKISPTIHSMLYSLYWVVFHKNWYKLNFPSKCTLILWLWEETVFHLWSVIPSLIKFSFFLNLACSWLPSLYRTRVPTGEWGNWPILHHSHLMDSLKHHFYLLGHLPVAWNVSEAFLPIPRPFLLVYKLTLGKLSFLTQRLEWSDTEKMMCYSTVWYKCSQRRPTRCSWWEVSFTV